MIANDFLYAADPGELGSSLTGWQNDFPGLGVLLLLPEAEKHRVPELQSFCRHRGIPVMGAIFPALLTDAGFLGKGVIALRFDQCPGWFLIEDLHAAPADGAKTIGAIVSARLAAQPPADADASTLFLIFDGMLPNIGTILYGIFGQLHRQVRYAGVNAGSETFQPMPCLFDATRCVDNGVLGLLLPPSAGVVVEHGYPVSRSLMKATSSTGNRIDKIDGRTPLEVYQEVIKAEYGVTLTRENFYDYAVHYPFGEVEALNILVRIPVALNADGSLLCVGEIPDNALLRLIQAPALESSICIERIASGLNAAPHPPLPLMTFYCAGRRMHFGADAEQEIRSLKQETGATALYGALSLGEIDCDPELGIPQFHNAALVCVR